MNALFQRLFSVGAAYDEASYLEFLSSHVPNDLAKQLEYDAAPELQLNEYVGVEDLMQPLALHAFPKDWDSRPKLAFRVASLLEWIIVGYSPSEEAINPYKQTYVASYYLYLCFYRKMTGLQYLNALLLLVQAAPEMTLEGQFQVCRLLGALIPEIPIASVVDPTPLSSASTALSLIVANILGDISEVAEVARREEDFEAAWRVEAEEESMKFGVMKKLAHQGSVAFGATGKVRRAADRFQAMKMAPAARRQS